MAAARIADPAWRLTALAAAATVFALGTSGWYYRLYGRDVDAMTPAEEGFVVRSRVLGPCSQLQQR